MHHNFVKQKLRDGGASIGTMLFEFNTTGIARLAANAGAEFFGLRVRAAHGRHLVVRRYVVF